MEENLKFYIKVIIILFIVFSFFSCITNERNLYDKIITVYGTGEITFVPNIINLRIVFKNVDTNISEAVNKTRDSLTKFIEICNSFLIITDKIHTSNISTGKEYVYSSKKGEHEFIGYYSTITILISIDDFSIFEDFSSLILQFNDLSITNFRFTHSNIKEYESNANLLALDDAKFAAEKIAEHIGMRLSEVFDISYIIDRDMFTGSIWYYDVEGQGRSTGGIPVSPGILTLSKKVQVKFRMK